MSKLFEALHITEIECASCGKMKTIAEMETFMSCKECVKEDPSRRLGWVRLGE